MAIAVGDIRYIGNCTRTICLMTGQTANSGQPTDVAADAGSAQGVPNYPDRTSQLILDTGACMAGLPAEQSTLAISSTAGSGVMVGTFTLWGFLKQSGKWYPIKVNGGAALAELASPGDTIRYTERFLGLGHWDRLYLELSAVGGTATAFEAYLTTAKQGQ